MILFYVCRWFGLLHTWCLKRSEETLELELQMVLLLIVYYYYYYYDDWLFDFEPIFLLL